MKVSFTSISWFLSSVLNAQQSYPPQLPNAEILLYQEGSDVELNLHVYKPADWTSEKMTLPLYSILVRVGLEEVPAILSQAQQLC